MKLTGIIDSCTASTTGAGRGTAVINYGRKLGLISLEKSNLRGLVVIVMDPGGALKCDSTMVKVLWTKLEPQIQVRIFQRIVPILLGLKSMWWDQVFGSHLFRQKTRLELSCQQIHINLSPLHSSSLLYPRAAPLISGPIKLKSMQMNKVFEYQKDLLSQS